MPRPYFPDPGGAEPRRRLKTAQAQNFRSYGEEDTDQRSATGGCNWIRLLPERRGRQKQVQLDSPVADPWQGRPFRHHIFLRPVAAHGALFITQ